MGFRKYSYVKTHAVGISDSPFKTVLHVKYLDAGAFHECIKWEEKSPGCEPQA